MNERKSCKKCGGDNHKTRRSKNCRYYQAPRKNPTTLHRSWVYLCMLLVIAVVILWLLIQQHTANMETFTGHDIKPYNISEIQHTQTPTVELDRSEPSMYFFRDARLQASQDILFIISFLGTLVLFKSYFTELKTLKDTVIILANQVSELKKNMYT